MFDKGLKLFNVVKENFGEAFDLFQMGAQFYTDVAGADAEKTKQDGFMPKKKFNFDSSIPTPRAQLRTMDAPVGLRNPNVQAAYRYFADNVARDTNLSRIVAQNYKAGISRKRVSTKQTVEEGGYGGTTMGSARASRVNRSTFRSRL